MYNKNINMKNIDLKFDGYWRDCNKSGAPSKEGVYCVYTCIYNQSNKTLTIRKLIYIGESTDVKNRVSNHEKLDIFLRQCFKEESICFSFAPVNSLDREIAEAALIYKHKPPLNDEYVDNYPFDSVRITTKGENEFLNSDFTVHKEI